MKLAYTKFILALALLGTLASCKKDNKAEGPGPDNVEKVAPDNFNYSTTKDVDISVRLVTNNNEPISGAVVTIVDPADAERTYFRAVSDASGYVRGSMNVPSYLDTVVVRPDYVGLINNARAFIGNKGSLAAIIGGPNGSSGDIVPEPVTVQASNGGVTTLGLLTTDYVYPSPYSGSSDAIVNTSQYPFVLGRPRFLEPTSDPISASLLRFINSSLPEGRPVTVSHPEFLSSSAIPNIVVKETSDVWITFVSEGATLRNTLAYYTYPTGREPNTANAGTLFGGIDEVTMVFPNASAVGSGGGLRSGDKVKLGRFPAGTTIAFVLIQDGWTGAHVRTSNPKFYTDAKFNPENSSALRRHSVLLYDDLNKLFLLGFEDLNRSTNSDNDFNDLVVYATSNPVTGISPVDVAPIDKGGDSDGDGVLDNVDQFPNDASRAFITYYPSKEGWATLAFEDNWPKKGDYDLNDLVVNYRYTWVSNAANAVVELTGEYHPVAAGAQYKNGFGVQFPFASSHVSSVTGQNLQGATYIQRNANGTEAGQTNAVIIPFDRHDNLIRNPDQAFFVNTDPARAKVTSSVATVKLNFSSPIQAASFGLAPFNPFLISDGRRGYEIHLPGHTPTDKADRALMGSEDDKSTSGANMTYVTKENWPWALSFTEEFKYPVEKAPIDETYLRFLEWAQSGGRSYADWYRNTSPGYRNSSNIYNK